MKAEETNVFGEEVTETPRLDQTAVEYSAPTVPEVVVAEEKSTTLYYVVGALVILAVIIAILFL